MRRQDNETPAADRGITSTSAFKAKMTPQHNTVTLCRAAPARSLADVSLFYNITLESVEIETIL